MINIYAYYFNNPATNTIKAGKTLIQSIPASSESAIKIINPNVKCDFGNAESMDFTIQNGTEYYDAFIQMRSFIQVDYDGETIFYGRVLTISNGFFGERKIHCEGAIAFLNDSFIQGVKKEARKKQSILNYIGLILDNHNKQVADNRKKIYAGEIPGNYSSSVSSAQKISNDSRKFGSDGWNNSKSAIEDLKSHYGGAFRIRYNGSSCYLDWFNHYYRSTINTQTIEVGKNLIDISGSNEVSNIFTVIIPIGKSKTGDSAIYLNGYTTTSGHKFNTNYLTVPEICKNVYDYGTYTDSQLNSGYHQADDYKNALDKYGRIFKTIEFEEAHDQKTLLQKASEWIKSNYQGGVDTFTVKALDLHFIGENTGKILVGDRVKIKYPIGTSDGTSKIVTRTLTCTSVSYDLYNPENNQYTFGIPANMLGKVYGDSSDKKQKKSTSSYKQSGNESASSSDDPLTNWRIETVEKMMYLKVWKRSNNGTATGPTGAFEDGSPIEGCYLQRISLMGESGSKWKLWVPATPSERTEYTPKYTHYLVWPTYSSGEAYPGMTKGHYITLENDEVESNKFVNIVINNKVPAIINYEYGTDLIKGEGESSDDPGTSLPSLIPSENGGIDILGSLPGENDGLTGIIGHIGDGSGEDPLTLLAADGQIEAIIGADGVTKYIKKTPDGRVVQVSIDPENGGIIYIDPTTGKQTTLRGLKFSTEKSDTFIGNMVAEGYAGQDGTIHIYKFGLGVEEWAAGEEGEMVVAYVDGDIVKIGSRSRTKKIYITGDQIILGDADSETTIIDTLKAAGVIDNALEPNALVANVVYSKKIGAIEGAINNIKANYIQTTMLSGEIAKITSVQVKALDAYSSDGSGVVLAKNVKANDFLFYNHVGSQSYETSINKVFISTVVLEGPTNNVYTLKTRTGDMTETVVGTFSRAVSLIEGTWSGNHYYVTVSPQNQTGGDTYLFTSQDGWGNDYKNQFHVYYIDTKHDNAHVDVLSPVANASVFKLKAADVKTIANDITSGIQVRSANNKGLYGDYKTLAMSLDTYSPSGAGGTKRCVVVKDGTAIVGRYDVSSVWTECYNTVEAYASTTTISPGGSVKVYAKAKASYDASSKTNKDYVTITASGYTHNASLYCSSISDADPSGHRTVTLTIQYSTSQSIPFSVGSRKTVYFN